MAQAQKSARLPQTQHPPQQPAVPAQQSSQDDSDESQYVEIQLGPSTQIASANYNPKTLDLIVQFSKDGSTYHYFDVDQVVISGWARADSVGSYFYHNIRSSFEYERLD